MKKIFLLLTAAALFFAACNDASKTNEAKEGETMSGSDEEAKEERNKKTALASVEAFSAHNVDAVFKDAAPDAVDYADGSMPPVKGVDSGKVMVNTWIKAFPDVKGFDLKAVADGDWVMVWGDWSGTWKGDFMGQKATGKSYKIKDVDIFRFNDEGKITEHHAVQSFNEVARQVGMKMPQQ